MTVELQRGLSATFHEGSQVWVPVVQTVNGATADGTNKRKVKHWRRGVVQVRGSTGGSFAVPRSGPACCPKAPRAGVRTEVCTPQQRSDVA